MKEFLICYDITDPRRLNRIASCLTKSSLRIQKVFLFLKALSGFLMKY